MTVRVACSCLLLSRTFVLCLLPLIHSSFPFDRTFLVDFTCQRKTHDVASCSATSVRPSLALLSFLYALDQSLRKCEMAGSKSYASATSAYAPLGVEQPHPSLALLDSTQPANRDALLRRHPHALDGMDGEVDHQQNEACVKSGSARKTNGFEREHESDSKNTQGKKDSEDRRPGSGFESTIKGHPAMEGRDPPEKIGGQLVEPCQSLDVPLSLCQQRVSTRG